MLAIGFGTCADSFREKYPGINLLSFSGGGLWRPDILDKSLGTYVLNDIWNWTKLGDDAAGVRTFDKVNLAQDRVIQDKVLKNIADQNLRDRVRAALENVKKLPEDDPRAIKSTWLLKYVLPVDQQRLCDYYVSAESSVFHDKLRVAPSRVIPNREFAYNDSDGNTRILNAVEISAFKDGQEFDDFVNVVKQEAARLKVGLPSDIGGLNGLWNSAEEHARRNGLLVPTNDYATRVQRIMDRVLRNPSELPAGTVDVLRITRQRSGALLPNDNRAPNGGRGDPAGDPNGKEHGLGGRGGEHGPNNGRHGEPIHGEPVHGGGDAGRAGEHGGRP
ncbi:hypothetical protein UCRPC4_g00754 [Phaeomoniella chlamydospora]|uniref:Uncharacterized protein n=1 Tax=Phaeomoniella chlamydospora TaxID=158046 RepID=A0A0G2HHL9_PHACM|nr:hypothetical protein UCRPC4_g00754 [Phaeomoniella chlamydospora]